MALYMKQQKETDVEAESDHYIRVLLRFSIDYYRGICWHLHKPYGLSRAQLCFVNYCPLLLHNFLRVMEEFSFLITLAAHSLLNYNSN